MAGREAVKRVVQQVRPILSVDKEEARKRMLNLYKAWYRQIPYIGKSLKPTNVMSSERMCIQSTNTKCILPIQWWTTIFPCPLNNVVLSYERNLWKTKTLATFVWSTCWSLKWVFCCSPLWLRIIKRFCLFVGSNGVERNCRDLEAKRSYYEVLERITRA